MHLTSTAAAAVTPVATADRLARRTTRRSQPVSFDRALIDRRTPGSDAKEDHSPIGNGFPQSPGQVINLQEDHGVDVGAAAMPRGVTNAFHGHCTAEVLPSFRDDWLLRWGQGEQEGEFRPTEGDVVTIPTWVFRGFTDVGQHDGWLPTAPGRSDTGGVIRGPSVLDEAAGHDLHPSGTLSVSPRTWCVFTAVEAATEHGHAEMVVVNGGDDRVRLHWSHEVWGEVGGKRLSRDADGCVAPSFLLPSAVEDD